MGLQQFLLAFMSAGLLYFAFNHLFAIIYIHKKILDKRFYFAISCFTSSLYIFFELLLSLSFSDEQYLIFHRMKLLSLTIMATFWLFTNYEFFFKDGKKYIAYFWLFIIIPIYLFVSNTTLFTSLPIKSIEVNTFISRFVYHNGTTQIFYQIFSSVFTGTLIYSIFYYFISKKKNKRYPFIIIFISAIFAGINDFLIAYGYYSSLMLSEYQIFIMIAFLYIEFLKEDRKTHFEIIDLKDEAIRRLRITEIYTRKSLVESIEKGEDPTKFQPNNVQIATLFTDIRDFTGISEGLQPLEVVELLNSYFNRMNSTIIKHKGEIDKLMGDCIMALFKDPDDALKSAIEIRTELAKFNLGTHQRQINNGIGLNYGEVIIGNIGSESKMDYTVVGDIVNTASRLEALTKYYKVPLIISEDLKVQLKDSYHIRFLDEALIKGKSTPVKIYEVYDFESDEKKETRERNHQPMQEAFALYQKGEFINAKSIYDELAVRNGDPSLSFYIKRCKNLQSQKDAGLLKDWNGVFEFMDK